METECVPIDSIGQDPANTRDHDERNIESIMNSLRRFGQVTPIVVDPNGTIRKGNGTYIAAKRLGWTEITITRTELLGSEATAYSIADNRTSDLSMFNAPALSRSLEALRLENFNLEAIGFTAFEADDLLRAVDKQAKAVAREFGLSDAAENSPALAAFLAARRKGRERHRDKDETSYWVCLVFQSFDQKEEFLKSPQIQAVPVVYDTYVDGQTLAGKLGIAVKPNCQAVIKSPMDKKLAAMVLKSTGAGAEPEE